MFCKDFIARFRSEAEEVGKTFDLNPVVILAVAAVESGWGESELARVHSNLFGLTAYGAPNEYWHGCAVTLREGDGMRFRKYGDTFCSFMDFARLIRRHYPGVADMSPFVEAFAKEIAYSRYFSEVKGGNREAYRKAICRVSRKIGPLNPPEGGLLSVCFF